jgi:hypothetical protein
MGILVIVGEGEDGWMLEGNRSEFDFKLSRKNAAARKRDFDTKSEGFR